MARPDDQPNVQTGAVASVRLLVGPEDTAEALGSGDVPLLGTPRVVALVEEAAMAAMVGAVGDESTTVGTRIELRHLAASPIGSEVVANASVTSVEGRRVNFAVHAVMGDTMIAEGIHERIMVRRDTIVP
jgi:fluoroacetyl-CoA thioesterase